MRKYSHSAASADTSLIPVRLTRIGGNVAHGLRDKSTIQEKIRNPMKYNILMTKKKDLSNVR